MTVSLPSIRLSVISVVVVLLAATTLMAFDPSAMIPSVTAVQAGFTVNGISVDVIAASPAEARHLAFAKAEAEAARQLLERLAVPAARALLPARIDDKVVQKLVGDVAIEEEKNSSAHYVALLSVRFRPIAVRTYLETLGVSHVEPPARPTLVIPLFQESTFAALRLWEGDDPWQVAWQRADTNRLVPIVMPSGDPVEQETLSPAKAAVADAAALLALARRRGAERTLVAHAIVLNAGEDGLPPIVEVRTLLPAPPLHTLLPLIDRIAGAPGDNLATVLDGAVRTVVEQLEADWRQRDTIRAMAGQGQEHELTLMLPVTSLAEWLEIRQRLKRIRLTIHTDLQALTCTLLQLHLRYAGDETQFATLLTQQGLKLDGYGPVRQLTHTRIAPASTFALPIPIDEFNRYKYN